jgi:uncharacterized protein (TIGR02145 family)
MKKLLIHLAFWLFLITLFSCHEEDGGNGSSLCGSVTDIDGNVYSTVTIGSQCWMQKNLNVSKYQNGDPIPEVKSTSEWVNLTTGAWCYYENDSENGKVFGKLYNWYAVIDSRGLAPKGWSVPYDDQWITLINYLGGKNVAGEKLKASFLWNASNVYGTNSSGFTALPGGTRNYGGVFSGIGEVGWWWSSSVTWTGKVFTRGLLNTTSEVYDDFQLRMYGFSVRCIKD